ncbi:putative dual specificity protein phosphatase DSP8, partial [Bienertia sinuspersici]
MEHLIIPTRNYLYVPSFDDTNTTVGFIHFIVSIYFFSCIGNASCGRGTYVHCKAKRGRSTTIAFCYLV